MDWIQDISAIVIAFGGLELLKWLYTRKSKSRMAEAEAELAKLKADKEEFHFLRERIDFLNKDIESYQITARETRKQYDEQTQHVRTLNQKLIDKEQENGDLKAKIAELLAERKMKLCERRGCEKRQPQSGY